MKNSVEYLLLFIAWVMFVVVVAMTWAGVVYPSGRAKAYTINFSKIHPMCIHRMVVQNIDPTLGDKLLIQVTSDKMLNGRGT